MSASSSPSEFAGFRFLPEVISPAVRWYLRYGLSGTVALSLQAMRKALLRWPIGWHD